MAPHRLARLRVRQSPPATPSDACCPWRESLISDLKEDKPEKMMGGNTAGTIVSAAWGADRLPPITLDWKRTSRRPARRFALPSAERYAMIRTGFNPRRITTARQNAKAASSR